MVPHYFIFQGVDSRTKGVHLISYPPIIRPARRVKYVSIPGRAGDVALEEGDHVYDAYDRTMEISNVKGASLAAVQKWLTGHGTMIVSNEPTRAYTVDLAARWQADKIIRGVWGGVLTMHTQPLKQSVPAESDITVTSSGATVTNPGDVPSAPLIQIVGSGTISLTLGGKTLALTGVESGWKIDCETGWVLSAAGAALYGVCTGEPGKVRLPVGASSVLFTGSVTKLIITPRWRYL